MGLIEKLKAAKANAEEGSTGFFPLTPGDFAEIIAALEAGEVAVVVLRDFCECKFYQPKCRACGATDAWDKAMGER